jgi:Arf-GAP/coiled-coil/ANK repeat/PH domain-containing protein
LQGYLLKQTSDFRRAWKRRFFVLDSQGMLYYYSNKEGSRREQAPRNTCSLLTATIKPDAEVGMLCPLCLLCPLGPRCCLGLVGKLRLCLGQPCLPLSAAYGCSMRAECFCCHARCAPAVHAVQDPSLRYAFRVVSPDKEYVLQAENEVEQQEWMQMLQVGGRGVGLPGVVDLVSAWLEWAP